MTRLAVLIDADNIGPTFAAAIFSRVATVGTASIRRIYGRPTAIAAWSEAARAEFCEVRPQNSLSGAKNGTDIALAVDAMDILHERDVEAFCIVSNDRDFIPLATRLRASGKRVHAICMRCDERLSKAFQDVFELDPAPPVLEHPIVAAYRAVAGSRDEIGLGEVGSLLRKHAPDLIPKVGKSPLRRSLEATGRFELLGDGSKIRVRLR